MFLGRSKILWLALVAALLNTSVVVFNVPLTTEQIATLNALAVAVFGVIANENDPTTAGTFSFTTKPPSVIGSKIGRG